MRIDILTIFPHIFDSYLKESLLKRAQQKKLLRIHVYNLRDFSRQTHHRVDARPFGGGPGMVLQVEPIYRTLQKLRALKNSARTADKEIRVILFSTRGKKLDARTARRLSKYSRLILVCGRYEGVDERVAAHLADEELSIGDYILSGGELPALVLLEATGRFLPGFLSKSESLEETNGSCPAYTRPAEFQPRGSKPMSVPKVLLSGDHHKIEAWRRQWTKPI